MKKFIYLNTITKTFGFIDVKIENKNKFLTIKENTAENKKELLKKYKELTEVKKTENITEIKEIEEIEETEEITEVKETEDITEIIKPAANGEKITKKKNKRKKS